MYIDIVLICLIIVFSIIGFKRGMMFSLFSLFSVIISLYLSFLITPTVSELLNKIINIENIKPNWLNTDNLIDAIKGNNSLSIIMKFLTKNVNYESVSITKIIFDTIIFIVLGFIFRLILRPIIKNISKLIKKTIIIGAYDRLFGSILGFCKGILFLSCISFLIIAIYNLGFFDSNISFQIDSSTLIWFLSNKTDFVLKTFLFT